MAYQIKLTQPVIKGETEGSKGYFVDGMIVITSDGTEHQVPLSGFYFFTQEEKDAAPENERARMIVPGETELAQVEAALEWLAQRYEDGIVQGKNIPDDKIPGMVELVKYKVEA